MRLELTNEKLEALKNILEACIDQYETSGGDIDYTGLDGAGLDIMKSMFDELNDIK